MKITFEVNDLSEVHKLRDFLNKATSIGTHPALEGESVDKLMFTMRTAGCLRQEGITTVEALAKMTQNELLKIPNLGRKSLNEIIEELGKVGVKLA